MAKHQKRTFELNTAKREGAPVLLGIAGPSSSGKTYSALRVAMGVQSVVGGDVAVIDTENKRALLYADFFKFLHIPFDPPFNPLSYLDALQFAQVKKVKTVVVDSFSHEHEGAGGYLDMHEAELDRLAGDNWDKRDSMNMLAWQKPSAERRALGLAVERMGINVIMCFRAKEKIQMVKVQEGGRTKTKILPLGFQPIAGDTFVYMANALAMLPPNSGGIPNWSAEAAKISKGLEDLFQKGKPLDEETGVRLARYMGGGKPEKAQGQTAADRRPPPREDERMEDDIGSAWQPADGWPKFTLASKFITWSREFLGKANAVQAHGFSQQFAESLVTLQTNGNNGNEGAAKAHEELSGLLKKALAKK